MSNPAPLRILIVEDEALLAMELESLIEEAGHSVAGWAAGAHEAQALIGSRPIDLVFLDVQLREGGSGIEVARHLTGFPGIHYVFLTANPKRLPEDLAGACGVIAKPYSINGLLNCLDYLEQGIRRPPPSVSQPDSFTLAPRLSGNGRRGPERVRKRIFSYYRLIFQYKPETLLAFRFGITTFGRDGRLFRRYALL